MRILHLLDASSSQRLADGALVAISLLQRRDPDNEHLLVCFAPPSEISRARKFGAIVDSRIAAQARRRRSASIALRRYVERIGSIDRIQPWSSLAADLACSIPGFAQPAPPLPLWAPVNPDHCTAEARRHWRRRFEINDDELAITLLDLDPNTSSAGAFGLAIAPMTCAMQDRTLVGLIPEPCQSDGSTRARRYAGNAGDAWRIELHSAPRFAAVIAADVVLCPTASTESDPWRRYSSTMYALACAQAGAIPVVAGSFDLDKEVPLASQPGVVSAKPGRVGLVIALINACQSAGHFKETSEAVLHDHCPDRWLSRWRERQADALVFH